MSTTATFPYAATVARAAGRPKWALTALAFAALAVGAAAVFAVSGPTLAALFAVGAAFGAVFQASAFGFTAGFRAALTEGRTATLRAVVVLLAASVLVFLPLIAQGSVAGQPLRGFVFPVGVEVAIGAFLFGVGMQIAGACASGMLYSAGGGSTRMAATILAFLGGATFAAFTYESWGGLPALRGVSLLDALGLGPALAVNLAAFGLIYLGLRAVERRRFGAVASLADPGRAAAWPLIVGALALAVLNVATLLLAGRPFGIAQAFPLWGSQAVDRLGLADPVFWAYWEEPIRADVLHRLPLADTTSVMTIALPLGALAAAAWTGRFNLDLRVKPGALAASLVGGLLLGFGAVMATGCNISALVSGVSSGSLHGWLWLACAVPGNLFGVWLRPLFGLSRT